jgi:hypothetical protein
MVSLAFGLGLQMWWQLTMLQICERWEQIKRKGAYNIYGNYPHIFEGLANNIHTKKALVQQFFCLGLGNYASPF